MQNKKYLIIDSRPYGMFSIFLHTLDCLKWCELNDYEPYIRWGSGRVDCNISRFREDKTNFSTEQKRINNTRPCLYTNNLDDNPWDYYFESINKTSLELILKSQYDIADIFITGELDHDLKNKFLIRNLYSYDKLKLWEVYKTDQNHRKEVNEIIKKYIKIKPDIEKKCEDFMQSKNKDCDVLIGVHVRGTDKKTEHPFRQLNIDDYIKQIKNLLSLNKDKKCKIYVASDNNESIIALANEFDKNNIISYPSIRMQKFHGAIPICLNNQIDKKLHGEQAIIETLLLSKCQYIIGTDSNLTAAASYFNPQSELVYLDRIYGA
jgi:hypothetical protein